MPLTSARAKEFQHLYLQLRRLYIKDGVLDLHKSHTGGYSVYREDIQPSLDQGNSNAAKVLHEVGLLPQGEPSCRFVRVSEQRPIHGDRMHHFCGAWRRHRPSPFAAEGTGSGVPLTKTASFWTFSC
ncbi:MULTISPECIES: hypothetical protein, partial [Rhizobium]|uniref:hypothetical protein n=2 Tax=Rhizobium TaxID=379 RepID=UPI001AED047C